MNHSNTPTFIPPVLAFAGMSTLFSTLLFYDRVHFYPNFYLVSKLGFSAVFLWLSVQVRKWNFDDLKASIIVMGFNIYCLINMWFAPMHSMAFICLMLVSSFVRFQRRWLFLAIQLTGLTAMLLAHLIQYQLNWKIPSANRLEVAWMIVVGFGFALLLREYAVKSYQSMQDRLLRTSLVGMESTRLLHDLKGMLSSPIMLLDGLKNREHDIPCEVMEKYLVTLTEDLHDVSTMIKSIHRLVVVDEKIIFSGILSCVESAKLVLHRRLAHVKIEITNEDRVVKNNPDRLHSVFFNLFLNSLEAFQRNNILDPKIEIFWEKNLFVFRDNAGGFPKFLESGSSKGSGSGLGLLMVRNDLHHMQAKLKISGKGNTTSIALDFQTV